MEEQLKVIVFQLKEQSFGVDVRQILSIERLQQITEVPRTSEFIKGIISLRGETIPIIDLKERLHIGETVHTDASRILIVTMDSVRVGLIVDSATEVIDIEYAAIESPPAFGGVDQEFLKGVAMLKDGILLLLDLEHVLNLDEINVVREMTEDSI